MEISATEAMEKLRELGNPIGSFANEWRQRRVVIFDHPVDPALVATMGYPVGNEQTVIYTEEPRESFTAFIGKFNGRYK